MTELANGTAPSQESASSAPVTASPAPSANSAPTPSASDERTFRQSDVNEIVKRAKNEAIEGYRRLQTEQPDYFKQKYGEQATPQQQPVHQQASPTSEQDFRRIAAEEAQRLRDNWLRDNQAKTEADNAQRTVQNFWNKLAPGKDSYEDFEKVTGDIGWAKFPNAVQLLAEYVDNSHDLAYDMGNNRVKLAQIESLAERSPDDAVREIQRWSQSIKDNHAAAKIRQPNAPLSQLRPSNTGTDNGVKSVKDYRRIHKV